MPTLPTLPALFGVTVTLPLRTARDRCLWHVGGTAGENGIARTWRQRLLTQPDGGAVLGESGLLGTSPEGSRQPGGSLELWPTS